MCFSVYAVPGRPANEAMREQALLRLKALDIVDDAVLDGIAAEARQALGTGMAAITLIHDYEARLVATVGIPSGVYNRSTSLCGHAILAPERPFVVADTLADDRFAENPYIAGEDGVRFYAAAPLIVDGDLAIGTLCVFDRQPRPGLSDAQQRMLVALADKALLRLRSLATDGEAR